MTLNDILTAALWQLDRGADPQTMERFGPRLTGFVNEAQMELAKAMSFCRTEETEPEEGIIDLSKLSRFCFKVIKVEQLGKKVRFGRDDTGHITVPYSEAARVTYVCSPKKLELPGDVCELPQHVHGLIVTYAVGRERMMGDPSAQRGAAMYLSMFEAGKARLRSHHGDAESYSIVNRYS